MCPFVCHGKWSSICIWLGVHVSSEIPSQSSLPPPLSPSFQHSLCLSFTGLKPICNSAHQPIASHLQKMEQPSEHLISLQSQSFWPSKTRTPHWINRINQVDSHLENLISFSFSISLISFFWGEGGGLTWYFSVYVFAAVVVFWESIDLLIPSNQQFNLWASIYWSVYISLFNREIQFRSRTYWFVYESGNN